MSDQHDSLLQGLFRNPKSFVPVAFDGGDPLLSRLTVTLPGEALRALVQRVVGKDAVMVFLDQPPLMTGKTHSFKTGDFIPCRRSRDEVLRTEVWLPIPESELPAAPALPS